MIKLIFSAPVSRGALMEFFAFRNFTYSREFETETEVFGAWVTEWVQNEETSKIAFYDDSRVGLEYLVIESDSIERELELTFDIQRGPFQFYSREAIFAEFDNARTIDELIFAFAKMVVSAPDYCEAPYLNRIAIVLRHEHPTVRAECLALLRYVSWPELLPMVTQLRMDPDAAVRSGAATLSSELKALELG